MGMLDVIHAISDHQTESEGTPLVPHGSAGSRAAACERCRAQADKQECGMLGCWAEWLSCFPAWRPAAAGGPQA